MNVWWKPEIARIDNSKERAVCGRLFVYGTLQLPQVMQAVVGRTFRQHPGRLAGFRRGRVNGRSFPGIVPDPHAEVNGIVYSGLEEAAFLTLDHFEGPLYFRQSVVVDVGGRTLSAQTYVVPPQQAHWLSADDWDLEVFRGRDLEEFLEVCTAFRQQGRAASE